MILWRLQDLRSAIRQLSERVEVLEAKVQSTTKELSAMPKGGSGSNDMVERLIILKDKLQAKRDEYEMMVIDAEMRIADIQDPLISTMVTYKYVNNYGWRKVARKVGGGNTPDSCRMMVKRYLKKHMSDFM